MGAIENTQYDSEQNKEFRSKVKISAVFVVACILLVGTVLH
jgi:hypothetical protein